MSGRGERKKDNVLVPDSCWEDLANAIVVQAVDDYLAAQKVMNDDPDNCNARLVQKDILAFLKSDWYRELTGVDPRSIVRHLENRTGTDIDF